MAKKAPDGGKSEPAKPAEARKSERLVVTHIGGGGTPATQFWTVAEIAETLRVSKMSVYRLIHTGQLEAVQFGRSFRVSEDALQAYLKKAYYSAG